MDGDTGQRRSKHFRDARGTVATKLMLLGLDDGVIADVMGWSPDQVAQIRAVYVDRTAYHVALGRKISRKLQSENVGRAALDTRIGSNLLILRV